jgi:hypothetical protein
MVAKAGELNLARTVWGLRHAATPKPNRPGGRGVCIRHDPGADANENLLTPKPSYKVLDDLDDHSTLAGRPGVKRRVINNGEAGRNAFAANLDFSALFTAC